MSLLSYVAQQCFTDMAKVVLITGCSSGIGMKAAVSLAKDKAYNCKVYATMRNLDRKGTLAEEAGETLEKNLFIRKLDVSSDSSVEELMKEITEKENRLDVLINNAGQGLFHCNETLPMQVAENIMNCNFLGVVRTCKAAIPFMKRQKSGHIINVTSLGGIFGVPFNAVYCASKFAVDGFSEALASEMRHFKCHVSVVAPGPVNTKFVDNAKSMMQSNNLDLFKADPETEKLLRSVYDAMFNRFSHLGQTPQEVADVIISLMKEEKPRFRVPTSEGLAAMVRTKLANGTGESAVDFMENTYIKQQEIPK